MVPRSGICSHYRELHSLSGWQWVRTKAEADFFHAEWVAASPRPGLNRFVAKRERADYLNAHSSGPSKGSGKQGWAG